jgi:phage anti-repressor protein
MHKQILESDNLTNNRSFILVKKTKHNIAKITYGNIMTDTDIVADIDLIEKKYTNQSQSRSWYFIELLKSSNHSSGSI